MPKVEIRWRPSGGRGEYEHVPQEILLERRIVVDPVSVPGALITTDAWGRVRDGKPRLRRDNPNDRTLLNVPQLIAALALLPDPRREDKGSLVLPLREKDYVISAITFSAHHAERDRVICRPQRLKILHDSNEIDLVERLVRIAAFLIRKDLPAPIRSLSDHYQNIVRSGAPTVDLREISNALAAWLEDTPLIAEAIEAPSEKSVDSPADTEDFAQAPIDLSRMTADETKRRLVAHYSIDRNRKIRKAKVSLFRTAHGRVFCENCTFDFERKYGDRGKGFIEVHHLLPLAALLPNSITSLGDLMLLCANCHRIMHRTPPILSADDLRAITRL